MENYDQVGISSFYGGQSIDAQLGQRAQYYYGRHIDSRKNPTQFTILPAPALTSGAVVTDLILDMTQSNIGTRFAVGDAGNVYKITTGGVWSSFGKLNNNSGAGILYRSDVDMVYISGQTGVARIKNVATSPVFEVNFFQRGNTTTTTCYKTGGLNSYNLATTVSETGPNMRTFVSDIEPFYSIKVKVIAKGTGNWTLTLHDDANNSLGTSTVTNANLVAGQNEFVFSTPVRALVSPNGRTYHFHLTSTVADGTAATTTNNSLADCDMELWANALVTTINGWHPIYQFANMTLIGNERYVASYEPLQDSPTTADFTRHRLTFPPGYEACGFAQLDVYVAIAAEKRSSTGEYQEGKIFLWDGVQTTYNRFWDIPEGSPESIFSEKNIIEFIAGGSLYRSAGTQPVKIRTFRNTDSEYSGVSDVTHAPVHGMTIRRGILLIGYPFSTTNQTIEHGVYAYGHIANAYPESWTFNYTTSGGNYLNNGTNNLRIGMVKNYNDTLYISWRDDSQAGQKYGVDIVNNLSAPAADFDFQALQFQPTPYHPKLAGKILATFNSWPAGATIRLKYKIDGATNWTYGDYYSTVGGLYLAMDVNKVFNFIQFGAEGTVGSTTPTITYVGMIFDPQKDQREN